MNQLVCDKVINKIHNNRECYLVYIKCVGNNRYEVSDPYALFSKKIDAEKYKDKLIKNGIKKYRCNCCNKGKERRIYDLKIQIFKVKLDFDPYDDYESDLRCWFDDHNDYTTGSDKEEV